jgi:hypothetical protein
MRQWTTPDWTSLEEIVGAELMEHFMWMCELKLADGARVHAYKHRWTRRYLHLADDGRAFSYTGTGRYREVDRYAAISSAFEGWEICSPTEAEAAALEEALRNELPPGLHAPITSDSHEDI